ncbi:hypothetical protein QVD17_16912 [Tagetes erecta]|uniref:Uncharacterized protein n=1 Tax=Tagetes erecta TaxID=13708 RepID=A0AAD8KRF4_TARER|nr:hypothetical protein QVD17_16912 [Tagetes erecta]
MWIFTMVESMDVVVDESMIVSEANGDEERLMTDSGRLEVESIRAGDYNFRSGMEVMVAEGGQHRYGYNGRVVSKKWRRAMTGVQRLLVDGSVIVTKAKGGDGNDE